MKELIKKVVEWGKDRGLDKVGFEAQARYTLKETAELVDAYADQNIDKIKDAVGDILVTVIVGASNDNEMLDYVTESIESIYNEDRDPLLEKSQLICSAVRYALMLVAVSDSVSYYLVINNLQDTARALDIDLKDCLSLAYDEIKNRKGKVVNGQFIKE